MKTLLCAIFLCFAVAAHAEESAPPVKNAADVGPCVANLDYSESEDEKGLPLYVMAPTITLHEKPTLKSRSLGEVPIGTELRASCKKNGLLRVWVSDVHGIIGWVRGEQTTPHIPKAKSLHQALLALPKSDVKGRREIAEQWAAIAPLDLEAQTALVSSLKSGGDRKALDKAQAQLAILRSDAVTRRKGEPQAIFIFNGSTIKPIATLHGKKLENFGVDHHEPDEEKSKLMDQRFAAEYFAPRRAYHFYRDGAPSGVARVSGRGEYGCSSMDVHAAIGRGEVAWNQEPGVATNFPMPDSGARAINARAEDLQALQSNGATILRQHGVNETHIASITQTAAAEGDRVGYIVHAIHDKARQTDVFVAVFYGGFTSPSLEQGANKEVKQGEKQDGERFEGVALTVIVERSAQGPYTLVYQKFAGADSEEGFDVDKYLTHADINSDGSEDLFFFSPAYEGWSYFVLGRENGEWKEIVTGGLEGC